MAAEYAILDAPARNPPKAVHSQAAIVKTTAKTSTVHGVGSAKRLTNSAAPRADAVRMRILSIGFGGELRGRFAEAPLALREELERRFDMRRRELRPQDVAEIKLGVR